MANPTPTIPARPVVIIGAPRSGTNMLRDVLAAIPGVATWPCDEINYIWRHGNARHPHDELEPTHVSRRVRIYVRRAFARIAHGAKASIVVEKTCANSLRVPFVEEVVPEARYIYIVRDGRDAAASAMQRWQAMLDLGYIARKARFVPWTDLPYYGLRYLANRAHRVLSAERRLATWGPRFPGLGDRLRRDGLAVACASQWARCVQRSSDAFGTMPQDRVIRIRYEVFVESPEPELRRILELLDLPRRAEDVRRAVAGVTPQHRGKWRHALSAAEQRSVAQTVASQLEAHGYA